MKLRTSWDEFEVALLIDACNQVSEKNVSRNEMVHELSIQLRKRALQRGVIIDEVFRNENGISLKMTKMNYLLTNGEIGLQGASKLYVQMAELYKFNHDKFAQILIEAKT